MKHLQNRLLEEGLSKISIDEILSHVKDLINEECDKVEDAISWHIESQQLQGIENEYDQGWYDCLKMVARYFEEEGNQA